jgi:hypothetical protein
VLLETLKGNPEIHLAPVCVGPRSYFHNRQRCGQKRAKKLLRGFGLSDLAQKFRLNVANRLVEGGLKLLEILLIEKELVLLILFFPDTLALRDRNVKILLRFRGLDIEEVRSLPCANPTSENLLPVLILQRYLLIRS